MTASIAVPKTQPGQSRWRVAAVLGLSLPLFAWVALMAPLAQDREYHGFADQRRIFGVPHFWNVASNLPFAVIGLLGCWWLIRAGRSSIAFAQPAERLAYFVFFFGEFLTCFGSGYYHFAPSNETLVWDRLVFSLMLTSFFAIVITEFISQRAGRLLLLPNVALGLYSVLYWRWSELAGRGDLRLYLLVQFYPVIAIPLIMLLFRSRYTRAGTLLLTWALYGVAKAFELFDLPIYELTGFWSGHTLQAPRRSRRFVCSPARSSAALLSGQGSALGSCGSTSKGLGEVTSPGHSMTIGGKVLLCAAAFVPLVVMLREEFVPIPLAFYSGVFGLPCFVAHVAEP